MDWRTSGRGGAHGDDQRGDTGARGDALAAVRHLGGHVQIIASAGSEKTEVVSQRAAQLLVDAVPAAGIVDLTFTERAAAEF